MVANTHDTLEMPAQEVDTDEASAPFIGKWNRLVSHTNWEKGRIVCLWREALVETGGAASECSDEAWAMRVGGVSAGHVGRLRRVWQRFGDTCEEFDGLYWTHFLVAMDWDDAEMWLEGAAQSGWSVSQMRAQRWEALGSPEEEMPSDDNAADGNWDDDSPILPIGDALRVAPQAAEDVNDTDGERTTSASEAGSRQGAATEQSEPQSERGDGHTGTPTKAVRPFADLPELPDDIAEAFEQFKIAIVAQRLTGWQETSRDDVLSALEALKTLVLAPSDEQAR